MEEISAPSAGYLKIQKVLKVELSKAAKENLQGIKESVSLGIIKYRLKHGLNLEELAKEIGVSRMQLYRWEKLKSKPSKVWLEKLTAMGVIEKQ